MLLGPRSRGDPGGPECALWCVSICQDGTDSRTQLTAAGRSCLGQCVGEAQATPPGRGRTQLGWSAWQEWHGDEHNWCNR